MMEDPSKKASGVLSFGVIKMGEQKIIADGTPQSNRSDSADQVYYVVPC